MEQCIGQGKRKWCTAVVTSPGFSSHLHVFTNLEAIHHIFNLKLRAVWQRWLALYQRFIPPFQGVVFCWKVGSLARVTLLSTAPPPLVSGGGCLSKSSNGLWIGVDKKQGHLATPWVNSEAPKDAGCGGWQEAESLTQPLGRLPTPQLY